MKKKLDIPMFVPPTAGPHASNHLKGEAFFKNQVDIVTPEYDGMVKTGRALALGATNDLPIPIHHTLGADIYNRVINNGGFSAVPITDGYTLSVTTSSGSDSIGFETTEPATEIEQIVIKFDAVTGGDSIIFDSYLDGVSRTYLDTPLVVVDGSNALQVPNYVRGSNSRCVLYAVDASTFSFDCTNITMHKITSMANSFLTYWSFDDEIIQLGNAVDGGSSKELVDTANDATAWSPYGTNLVEQDGDAVKITYVDSTTGAYLFLNGANGLSQNLEIGKDYLVSFQAKVDNGACRVRVFYGTDLYTDLASTYNTITVNISPTAVDNTFIAFAGMSGTEIAYIKDISVKEILPTSTEYIFNDVTLNNILTHQMPFSAGDLNLIQQEPNLIAALAMGEATPISSVTLDADDSWYACSEVERAYVVDQRAGYGADITVDCTSISVDATSDAVFNTTIDGITSVEVDVTTVDTVPSASKFINCRWTGGTPMNVGNHYFISADVENLSGTVYARWARVWGGEGIIDIERNISGKEPISGVVKYDGTNGSYYKPEIVISSSNVCSFIVSNTQVREATASEIADYDESIRLINQQKGLQTTALLLDNAGVPESYNSTPNTARVYDDTIISTGFKPSIARYSIEETVTGELQDFGSEVVVNGGFDTDTDWNKGTLWTIENGVASLDGSQSSYPAISQLVDLIVGKQYLFSFEIVSISAGSVRPLFEGSDLPSTLYQTEVGVYTYICTAAIVTCSIGARSDTAFVGSIDNISVKELTTTTQRTEQRLLTHGPVDGDKYYINGILQAVTPPLPDPAVTINLNNVAKIGYPDTIQSRAADFKVHSEVIVPTLDLDHDGLPDTVVINDPSIGIITVDDDSINVDLDGDGDADIIIPRT